MWLGAHLLRSGITAAVPLRVRPERDLNSLSNAQRCLRNLYRQGVSPRNLDTDPAAFREQLR
jgi:hypothetical protein